MSNQRTVGPVRIAPAGDGWRITLPSSEELEPEMPPNLEQTLAAGFSQCFGQRDPVSVAIDLSGLLAISSHQLGLMIAVQKTLRARLGRVKVTGASENVKRLLELTNTAQFFELA
ncbi:MAG: STAS domain-containing protein [Planctomycetes bacterium]|nr:STAS domain-containing protein [Planctomycetota bacterium]